MFIQFVRMMGLLSLVAMAVPVVPQNQTEMAHNAQVNRPVLVVVGDEEIVFDWTTDRCDAGDIPDLPARAFRDAQGQVQLIATHHTARRSIGPDLDHQTHDCAIIMHSHADGDPSMFNDYEWLAGLYTEDGETIYVTVHNEYQGHNHPGQCPSGQYFDCWYNTLTSAVSTDGGTSYTHPVDPPGHLVATLPYPYEGGAGPYGYFEPSNIIKGKDGYYYEFFRVDDYQVDQQWTCLMRTDNLADARAWRVWDGTGFALELANPYVEEIGQPRQQVCAPISQDAIGLMHEGVTFNTYLNQYVLVGPSADHLGGREVWGIYYAFSDDLIHWTRRQLLFEIELPWTYQPGDDDPIAYPSLLDPDSPTRNFETTDQTAYLYFTGFNYQNHQMTLDRDLIRVPVQFFRSDVEAQNPGAVTNLSADIITSNNGAATVTGILTDANGQPIPDASVEMVVWPSDTTAYEYTVSGTVPANATRAVAGYRVNMECACAGTAEFSLYELRYTDGEDTANRILNPEFNEGLSHWSVFGGDGFSNLENSDRGSGMMVHVVSDAERSTAINSDIFTVTPGSAFDFSVGARIMPGSGGSGYFALMFLDSRGEIHRKQINLESNALAFTEVMTDAEGRYAFTLSDIVSTSVTVHVRFPGDDDHLPTRVALDRLK